MGFKFLQKLKIDWRLTTASLLFVVLFFFPPKIFATSIFDGTTPLDVFDVFTFANGTSFFADYPQYSNDGVFGFDSYFLSEAELSSIYTLFSITESYQNGEHYTFLNSATGNWNLLICNETHPLKLNQESFYADDVSRWAINTVNTSTNMGTCHWLNLDNDTSDPDNYFHDGTFTYIGITSSPSAINVQSYLTSAISFSDWQYREIIPLVIQTSVPMVYRSEKSGGPSPNALPMIYTPYSWTPEDGAPDFTLPVDEFPQIDKESALEAIEDALEGTVFEPLTPVIQSLAGFAIDFINWIAAFVYQTLNFIIGLIIPNETQQLLINIQWANLNKDFEDKFEPVLSLVEGLSTSFQTSSSQPDNLSWEFEGEEINIIDFDIVDDILSPIRPYIIAVLWLGLILLCYHSILNIMDFNHT